MGWSIGYDTNWMRDIGYGVIAYCDHPRCNETIDRGLSYVCSGDPYGDPDGCGLYFCGKHHRGYKGDAHSLCPRCEAGKPPYKRIKPEHPDWIYFKLHHHSWADWREENPETVAGMREYLRDKVISLEVIEEANGIDELEQRLAQESGGEKEA